MALNIKKEFGVTRSRRPDISTVVYGKVPPQAPDLEEAVIGACMLERDTFEQVMEVIPGPECFYIDAHQKIFTAMCEVYNSGSPVDLLTITEHLRKSADLELIGGGHYLSKLTQAVLSSAHCRTHAMIVMEKFMQRELIRICGQAINDAYDDSGDVFDLMDQVETDVKGITAHIIGTDDITVGKSFENVLIDYNTQKAAKSNLIGVTTGYVDLDEITGGWKKPGLIILAAKPSEGKTALMLNFIKNAAKAQCRSKVYSLETGATNLTRRLAAAINRISFSDLNKGSLNDFQEELLRRSMSLFHQMKISITYKIFFIEDLEKSARKEKKKNPDLGLIAIDFIQLLKMRNPGKLTKFEIVGEVSRRLKILSAELDIPIIALSQLNRAVNQNNNKRPEPHNLAQTSELEQNADLIIFIWYKDSGNVDEWNNPIMEPVLIVAKNKDGKCGDVPIRFNADHQEWLNHTDFNQNTLPSFVDKNYQPPRDPSQAQVNWNDEF